MHLTLGPPTRQVGLEVIFIRWMPHNPMLLNGFIDFECALLRFIAAMPQKLTLVPFFINS